MKMTYDIRTTENAQKTLTTLTKVPLCIWEKYLGKEKDYTYTDYLVKEVVELYGELPRKYTDFDFIYFHITTSANECDTFKKYGILDLNESYLCEDSELRLFLDNHGISVDLDSAILKYNNSEYDISFKRGTCPRRGTTAYKQWSVGRKFYYDYTTCGFLSIWKLGAYGGQVHLRPEILDNIDSLLDIQLSYEWARSHNPYEVVTRVSGENILYDSDDNQSDEDKVLNYLTKAYLTAFGETSEVVVLIKDNIHIPPEDILGINSINYW